MLKLAVTKDYEELRDFFIVNGLEYDEDEEAPSNIIKMWRLSDTVPVSKELSPCESPRREKLIGGACLSKRENGEFVLDGIAIDPEYRGRDYGRRLVSLVLDETARQGGRRLVLVARKPEFYRRLDFTSIAEADSPVSFDCIGCPQNGVDCFPEIMIKEIEGPKEENYGGEA